MSLDNRLREGLEQIANDLPSQPIDLGVDLKSVLTAGRRRKVVRQAYRGIAVAAVVVVALFALPGLLRQLGVVEKVKTADDPPTETKLERDTNPGVDQPGETGGRIPPRGSGAEGGKQTGQGAEASQQAPQKAGVSAVTPTPNVAGTYSYSVSGRACGGLYGCGDMKEMTATFRQASGSHQDSTQKWVNEDGGRFEEERSFDFRPDGVYWEHYHGTLYNPQGAVMSAYACPELRAIPIRVWPAGAKPGDHFEYTFKCEGGSTLTSVEILRAETVSVGGRDVETLLAQIKEDRRTTEAWVFPAHYLWAKEHAEWTEDFGGGRYETLLRSMSPS